jgi:hypothetical protein
MGRMVNRSGKWGHVRFRPIVCGRAASETPRGYLRDIRVRWALEQTGLPYRVKSVPFRARNAEHFSHQPFGQVPWLTDGDISIFESGAILLHVGERSGADACRSADPRRHDCGLSATCQHRKASQLIRAQQGIAATIPDLAEYAALFRLTALTAALESQARVEQRGARDRAPARPRPARSCRTQRFRARHRSRSGCAPSRARKCRQSCTRRP